MRGRSIALLCVVSLTACDGNADPDGGPIIVPDAAMPDAGSDGGSDAGNDGGPGYCGSTRFDTRYWAPLPDSCLPLCTAETHDAVRACLTQACAQAAIEADTSPPVDVDTPYGIMQVSCSGASTAYSCPSWQQLSCDAELCPTEYSAWTTCAAARPDCAVEEAALDRCRDGTTAWMGCVTERVDACFPS